MKWSTLQDFEDEARRKLPRAYYDYFAGGAQDEVTLRANREAFEKIMLRPRVLRGGFQGCLETELLDVTLDMPILIAPTAFHRLAHPDGECATARAASDAQLLMIISMASTTPVEEITAASAADSAASRFWFQLYIQPDRGFTADLVKRAEAAGCVGLVVTVDSPVFGRHERDLRNRFLDLPNGLCCDHMLSSDHKPRRIEFKPDLDWRDIDWLRSITELPVVLKGVVHPDDARLAVKHDLSALIVSNHGGRQLDTMAPSIALLPAVVRAVQGDIPIILDGGIRRGTDVLKALALGADAVGVGRPVLWGLAAAGQEGVSAVLQLLRTELLEALALCGCSSLRALDEGLIFPETEPSPWRRTC
jgi:4-hydroxymandelate oxidase